IVTDNDEERPFSRDQRSWIYASAKRENNYFGFGSDNAFETATNYPILKHATFPHPEAPKEVVGKWNALPCAKVLGAPRDRRHAFRPASVVNISAMSFGSLSSAAVRALNHGAHLCGCLHNTGEGGISPYHLNGGDLIWQIGTGYFGARNDHGGFDLAMFKDRIAEAPVRAIEIKLSQGAKPGHGGILPGVKVTEEIAKIRGVKPGVDCISPPGHTAFKDADGLLDFVELLAEESGLPVGIKSAVGEIEFWHDLAGLMEDGKRGVDFITIDGGEGGTGAAPLAFADHVALPFRLGFARVFPIFARLGLDQRIVFIGSGRLGLAENALIAFALGCDTINLAREAMLSIGCIQAQRCHTDQCPTGVATQNQWLVRGLHPSTKAVRLANYVSTMRHELRVLSEAAGQPHPACLSTEQLELLEEGERSRSLREVYGYEPGWGHPGGKALEAIEAIMTGRRDPGPMRPEPAAS
ncbi:MAG: FMN-binding glutamate synthase family protein, partial [Acidobacteria bacterium]|nr:FMN-binding glutamate synthase family protein [Acidobacteriota bacterium]